ncbi:MAG: 2-oxo-hepta-3-ene-1,7-dioic acid hydratase [Rhizobiaceae bacterium]|nr:2-oxo-hepta-3-ene-1,7-dioic acid hydratase [Rhizobiaceae bacterium]
MMTPEDIKSAARKLYDAEQSGKQAGLLSLAYPDMVMDDAYKVQSALIDHHRANGRHVIGWKIGLTSKAMQAALNIDIPDSGVLLDNMLFANGAKIPAGRFIQPRIEAEVVFVMKSDLSGPNVTAEQVVEATDYVSPSLEILDTRILRVDPESGRARNICDTISDNAANGGIVMGDAKLDPRQVDMRWIGAIACCNGEVEETGLGAGVLNDPALGIAWLANRLAQYGDSIKAGEIVLSGSFIRPIEAPAGSLIEADFGEFGTVSCSFE